MHVTQAKNKTQEAKQLSHYGDFYTVENIINVDNFLTVCKTKLRIGLLPVCVG